MIKDSAWNNFNLNSLMVRCLLENNYLTPTDIQSHSLPYHEFKTDLILASKTGSGKTLCFGIPLLSDLMNELGVTASYDGLSEIKAPVRKSIRALIVTPTRELAVQIMNHFEKINKYTKKYIKIGVIIGGLSKEKQVRILSKCPQILIATPGRLWDMLDQEYNPFLQTLKNINYLVLDEADKMIEMGHFKELDKILSFIYKRENTTKRNFSFLQGEEQDDNLDLDDFYVKDAAGNKVSLKDSKLTLLNENQHMIKRIKNDQVPVFDQEEGEEGDVEEEIEEGEEVEEEEIEEGEGEEDIEGEELEDEEIEGIEEEEIEGEFDDAVGLTTEENEEGDFVDVDEDEEQIEEEQIEQEGEEPEEDDKRGKGKYRRDRRDRRNKKPKLPEEEMVDDPNEKRHKYRRTIVLSATLASSYDTRDQNKRKKKGKGKGKGKGKKHHDKEEMTKIKGGETTSFKMETLMKKIEFNGKPKLIDLTQESKLPETLTEFKCLCTDEEKILYIYHLLKENPGKNFIIFANTIPAAKRVHAVLTKLDIPAVCLHSEMQQRQRLAKLERFTLEKSPVLVCTDVASRGLDIPTVHFVIHYQIPKDCDTYVHRSGRTARIGREGTAYALVGPNDKKNYFNVCKALRGGEGLQSIILSKLALDKIQEMVDAATKLEHGEFLLHKQRKNNEWYIKNAKEAGMLIDDELQKHLDETTEDISKKRKIVSNSKVTYQKIKQNTGKKLINPNKSRSVFLDVSQISKLTGILSDPQARQGRVNNDQFIQKIPETQNRKRSSPRQKTPKLKNRKPQN